MGREVAVRSSLATRRATPAGACFRGPLPRAEFITQTNLQLASGLTPAMAELHACALWNE